MLDGMTNRLYMNVPTVLGAMNRRLNVDAPGGAMYGCCSEAIGAPLASYTTAISCTGYCRAFVTLQLTVTIPPGHTAIPLDRPLHVIVNPCA